MAKEKNSFLALFTEKTHIIFLALLVTDIEQFQSSILELIKFQIQSQKELHEGQIKNEERQIKDEEKFQQQILELKENNDKTARNFRTDP